MQENLDYLMTEKSKGKKAWVKKDGNPLFDVAMGSFDGAEVCELVGLHLLNKIKSLLGSNNVD